MGQEWHYSIDAYNNLILNEFHQRLIEAGVQADIFWVMGTDNFEIISPELVSKGFHMIVIENRKYEADTNLSSLKSSYVDHSEDLNAE